MKAEDIDRKSFMYGFHIGFKRAMRKYYKGHDKADMLAFADNAYAFIVDIDEHVGKILEQHRRDERDDAARN